MNQLAPLPDHRNVHKPWWEELWRRHEHITTPLRARGLPCDIEFGLSAYLVRVTLPDDSYLIISPPQEPASARPTGDPEGWLVTREDPDDQSLVEILYDSTPADTPSARRRPEARHGGNAQPLIETVEHRLTQLSLLPKWPASSPPALYARAASGSPDPAPLYPYGDTLRDLTDRLNAASHSGAASLLHQILEPTDGLLVQLGEFFEAAGEKAKEAEEDDGFELSYDLADAAAEIRNLGEALHEAEERMRALNPIPPAPHRPPSPECSPSLPPPAPPTTPPRRSR
ncbi:hypothetical protein GR131_27870 [Streptomyces sp. GF20]|uniref:hypothetical protein n=1 Tax=Streptomyces sp. GF20 TaxID=2692235 RepID=UPI0013198B87|nr:hypothetical protein [Streptomyces sp. GF20]QHC18939.1 hypothetical protein GR131_27870 [Streptomyces sp. GF20]